MKNAICTAPRAALYSAPCCSRAGCTAPRAVRIDDYRAPCCSHAIFWGLVTAPRAVLKSITRWECAFAAAPRSGLPLQHHGGQIGQIGERSTSVRRTAMRSHCVRMLDRCVRMLRAGNRLLLAGARLTAHSLSAQPLKGASKPVTTESLPRRLLGRLSVLQFTDLQAKLKIVLCETVPPTVCRTVSAQPQ